MAKLLKFRYYTFVHSNPCINVVSLANVKDILFLTTKLAIFLQALLIKKSAELFSA